MADPKWQECFTPVWSSAVTFLSTLLRPSSNFGDKLIEASCVTFAQMEEIERIREKDGEENAARKLFGVLRRRPKPFFKTFCRVLQEVEQGQDLLGLLTRAPQRSSLESSTAEKEVQLASMDHSGVSNVDLTADPKSEEWTSVQSRAQSLSSRLDPEKACRSYQAAPMAARRVKCNLEANAPETDAFVAYCDDVAPEQFLAEFVRTLRQCGVSADAEFLHIYDSELPSNCSVWLTEEVQKATVLFLILSSQMRKTLSSTSTLNPSLRSAVSGRHARGRKIQLVFLNGQPDESLIPPFLDGGTFYQIRGSSPSDFCTDEGFLALVKEATSSRRLGFAALGRDQERKCIIEKLDHHRKDSVNKLLLYGAPGIGKSTLARDVRLYWEHAGLEVKEVDMRRIRRDEWAVHFLQQLANDIEKKEDEARIQLMSHMARKTRPLLLLVENAEAVSNDYLDDFATFLDEIIEKSHDNVRCLIMSKKRFVQVDALSENCLLLDTLSKDASVELFTKIANGNKEKPVCTEEEAGSITFRCGGIPLNIETLAKTLQKQGTSRKMIERLDKQQQTLLDELRRGNPLKKTELYLSVLDISFAQLSDVEKETVVAVSAFPGSFETEEVAEVMSIDECDADCRVSDLTFWQETSRGHYEMHKIFKEFAHLQAQKDAHLSALYESSKTKVIELAASKLIQLSEVYFKDAAKGKDAYLQKSASFTHLITTDIAKDEAFVKLFCKVALTCPFVFDAFVPLDQSVAYYKKCSDAAAEVGFNLERCQLLCWVSQDLIGEGKAYDARKCIEIAEGCFQQLTPDEQKDVQGLLLYSKGRFTVQSREAVNDAKKQSEAAACLQNASDRLLENADLGVFRRNNLISRHVLVSLAIRLYVELANASVQQGISQAEKAIRFAKTALNFRLYELKLQGPDNHPDTFMCLNSEAVGYMEANKYKEALTTFRLAHEKLKTLFETHRYTAIVLANIGLCHQKLGNHDEAEKHLNQSFRMLKDYYGEKHKETLRSHYEYAVCLHHLNRRKEAVESFKKLLRLAVGLEKQDQDALDFDVRLVQRQIKQLTS